MDSKMFQNESNGKFFLVIPGEIQTIFFMETIVEIDSAEKTFSLVANILKSEMRKKVYFYKEHGSHKIFISFVKYDRLIELEEEPYIDTYLSSSILENGVVEIPNELYDSINLANKRISFVVAEPKKGLVKIYVNETK